MRSSRDRRTDSERYRSYSNALGSYNTSNISAAHRDNKSQYHPVPLIQDAQHHHRLFTNAIHLRAIILSPGSPSDLLPSSTFSASRVDRVRVAALAAVENRLAFVGRPQLCCRKRHLWPPTFWTLLVNLKEVRGKSRQKKRQGRGRRSVSIEQGMGDGVGQGMWWWLLCWRGGISNESNA